MAKYGFYRHDKYDEKNLPLYKAILSNAKTFKTMISVTYPPRDENLISTCKRLNIERSYTYDCQWGDELSSKRWHKRSKEILSRSDVLRVESAPEHIEPICSLSKSRIFAQWPGHTKALVKVEPEIIDPLAKLLEPVKNVYYFSNSRRIASSSINDKADMIGLSELEELVSALKETFGGSVVAIGPGEEYSEECGDIDYWAMEILPKKLTESAKDYFKRFGIIENRREEHIDPVNEMWHITGTIEQFFEEFDLGDMLVVHEDQDGFYRKDFPSIAFYDSKSREIAFIGDMDGSFTFCVTEDTVETYKKYGFVPDEDLLVRGEDMYDPFLSPVSMECVYW